MKKIIIVCLILFTCLGCQRYKTVDLRNNENNVKFDANTTDLETFFSSRLLVSSDIFYDKIEFEYSINTDIKNITFKQLAYPGDIVFDDNKVVFNISQLIGDSSNPGGWTPILEFQIDASMNKELTFKIFNVKAYNSKTKKVYLLNDVSRTINYNNK